MGSLAKTKAGKPALVLGYEHYKNLRCPAKKMKQRQFQLLNTVWAAIACSRFPASFGQLRTDAVEASVKRSHERVLPGTPPRLNARFLTTSTAMDRFTVVIGLVAPGT